MKSKRRNVQIPGYAKKLAELAQDRQLLPGEVYSARIRHDSWCAFLNGRGPCDCDPDVSLDAPGKS